MDDDRLRALLTMIGAEGEFRPVETPMDEIDSLLSAGLVERTGSSAGSEVMQGSPHTYFPITLRSPNWHFLRASNEGRDKLLSLDNSTPQTSCVPWLAGEVRPIHRRRRDLRHRRAQATRRRRW